MSIFLRIRTSVRLPRSLSAALQYRSMSSRYNSEDTAKPHSATELYEQACERSARLEQQWMLSRKNVQETSGNSPITFPSYWRGTKDEFGLREVDNRTEAQKAVERHSKYAWVPSNYGAKFVLDAVRLYFSLDETKAYSGVYLVSIAKKHSNEIKKLPNKTKKRKGESAAKKKAPTDKEEEGYAGKKAEVLAEEKEALANKRREPTDKKKSSFTFPYHERKVLFRADTFQEAIRLADALVEKMIKSKRLLASMKRYAPWRNEASTAAQINLLLRLGAKSREQNIMKVALTMNKGEVCSIITDAVMKFEKSPKPDATEDEGDHLVVQEVTSASDLHSNFMLSDGLWDLES
ncbi:hypothetical protein QFC20_005557 [Naganishia adeliensis]|uniref:Uncharacterized protein n=1 Tax=Naganishia adeliensis TaxID=92952 RepID=A0ACC2VLI0_9TREE|nr:hypothetical protein QFC20_005557 [Naganishia adeliensis]